MRRHLTTPGVNVHEEVRAAESPIASDSLQGLRIALVNDWLVHLRGQERVFEAVCGAFPTADIYTLVYDKQRMSALYRERGVRTSFVQHLPHARRKFRAYLPLYPVAAKAIDLSRYDVVIANSSAFIHGVSVGQDTLLVCYCHSPFRYLWSHYDSLIAERAGPFARILLPFRETLRKCDLRAARRVDLFVAPSRLVERRINQIYGRKSIVIAPPVDLQLFKPARPRAMDYFLVVSPLMRWKRVDIVVRAFNMIQLPLKIVGDGEEGHRLRAMAANNIKFVGEVPHDRALDLVRLYCGSRAVIIPSEEDFGLAALEAMACGRPVLAFQAGGVPETVVAGQTGSFFAKQTVEELVRVVELKEYDRLDPASIRAHVERYGIHQFQHKLRAEVASRMRRVAC